MVATLPNVPTRSPPLAITPLLYHTAPLGACDPLGGPLPSPHFYVDVSSVMSLKAAMLEKHRSQVELMKVMHKMDDFFAEMREQNRLFGRRVRREYAEAFWQHLGGGFQKDALLQETLADFVVENAAPHEEAKA